MKKLIFCPLLVLLGACATSSAPTTTPSPSAEAWDIVTSASMPAPTSAPVPYSLTLQGFAIAGFPGVHSAVVAGTPDQLVVLGGRRNGLHGFPAGKDVTAQPSFPKTEANTTVYVLDLTTRKLLGSASVTSLPASIASQLQSTNMQHQLLNGWLYLLGGYGPDPQTGTMTTLDTATVIDFNALVSAVMQSQPLDAAFASANIVQFEHPALAITGGELELLPDGSGATDFVLAFGQTYIGEYSAGGGLANQIYADGVRVFQFTYPANSARPSSISFVAAIPDPTQVQQNPDNPFHRRDYTLKPTLGANGKPRLIAYGGVFKGGRMEGFLNPVFIAPGTNSVTLTPNATNQLMNQYSVAAIQLFDGSSTMYTTFFGGISQYYWNAATNSLQRDAVDIAKGIDGLPFINSVTTLAMSTSSDTGNQYLHVGQTFPPAASIPTCSGTAAAYGGAESVFVLGKGVSTVGDGIVQLKGMTYPSVVGYLVGGIAATAPYASTQGTSCASGTIYAVTLNPTQATNTVQLVLPQ
jgi:hypothetical protein